ncbi:hypothetical protein [Arthrobacter sp. Marseille-P9274]|uniref:hypothetical protein n=1 Tax=Arthrobacter sp. Marseille-P9274 TaxID=2866572 RepID=UPI0021C8AB53|nr:hypothetical protein [Arthrobacter sp. Marseille-P9274]
MAAARTGVAPASRTSPRSAIWALASSLLGALLLALMLAYGLGTEGAGLVLAPFVALPVLMFALIGVMLSAVALARRTSRRKTALAALVIGTVAAVPPVWLWVWLLAG